MDQDVQRREIDDRCHLLISASLGFSSPDLSKPIRVRTHVARAHFAQWASATLTMTPRRQHRDVDKPCRYCR